MVSYKSLYLPPESKEEYRNYVPRTVPLAEQSDSCSRREVEKDELGTRFNDYLKLVFHLISLIGVF